MLRRSAWTLTGASAVVAVLLVVPAGALRAQDAPLPPAATIIAKSIEAAGGEAAFRAVSSMRKAGTFEVPGQGITGSVEAFSARPNKAVVRVKIDVLGNAEYGYDGKVGWEIDPARGPALVTGRRLTEMADASWFDGPLYLSEFVQELTTVARTEFDRRAAYQVKVVFKSGTEEMQYFDAETFLPLGSEARRELGMGPLPATDISRDYRRFGAILQPTTMISRTMGLEQVVRFTTIEYDTVPAAAFDLPPPIKALIR